MNESYLIHPFILIQIEIELVPLVRLHDLHPSTHSLFVESRGEKVGFMDGWMNG